MRAMILAAGRGERFRPITDTCPKPLIQVAGKPLIVYRIEALAMAGITDIIINVCHLGELIMQTLKDGQQWGVNIEYSIESPVQETAGGVRQALPLLGEEPFWCLSADIWTHYQFSEYTLAPGTLGHLICIPQAKHCPKPDYGLENNKVVLQPASYTYGNMAVLSPAMFKGLPLGRRRLPELFEQSIEKGQLTGELYTGPWEDVGTPERWSALEEKLNKSPLDA